MKNGRRMMVAFRVFKEVMEETRVFSPETEVQTT